MKTFKRTKIDRIVHKTIMYSGLLFGIIIAIAISFSKQIGDIYSADGKWEQSIFWYKTNYDLFKNSDSLKELCFNASMVNNTEITLKYVPVLLEKDILKEEDLVSVTVQYLQVLYDNGDLEDFKVKYRESISDFVGNNNITQPLSYISLDTAANHDTLLYALEIGDYILEVNHQQDIFKLPVYYSQALIYKKLGNDEMYEALIAQYKIVEKELLSGSN